MFSQYQVQKRKPGGFYQNGGTFPKCVDKKDVSCEKPEYIGLFYYPNGDFSLHQNAYLCAEGWDSSDAELVKVVCGELNVSAKVAGALIKEYRTLCGARQFGDDVFSISCGGDPAMAYDRMMRRTLLMQRIEEVLTPRELNLVRSYLGIGQPDEVGLTFQELAIRLNYNGPSGAEKALANRFACEVAALIRVFTRCSA